MEARLSSSGSDSDIGDDFQFSGGVGGMAMEVDTGEVMTYEYDENAQDYVGYVDNCTVSFSRQNFNNDRVAAVLIISDS